MNRYWLQGHDLSRLGTGFFSLGSTQKAGGQRDSGPESWTALRDRWEYSHLVRAILALLSLVALALAMA